HRGVQWRLERPYANRIAGCRCQQVCLATEFRNPCRLTMAAKDQQLRPSTTAGAPGRWLIATRLRNTGFPDLNRAVIRSHGNPLTAGIETYGKETRIPGV